MGTIASTSMTMTSLMTTTTSPLAIEADLSAIASAKVEAEVRDTDKALKEILEKLRA